MSGDIERIHTLGEIDKIFNLEQRDAVGLHRHEYNGYAADSSGNIIAININRRGLTDNHIQFLSDFKNLEWLKLKKNYISDISALGALKKLCLLDLSFNDISDISILRCLPDLMEINLARNKIGDISILIGLQKLKRINLAYNQIYSLPFHIINWRMEMKWDDDFHNSKSCGLILEGNPLTFPAKEIISNGIITVKAFMNAVKADCPRENTGERIPDQRANGDKKRNFFLSHASEDKTAYVLPLARELKKRGLTYWLDTENISHGDPISQRVNLGIAQSDYVVIFITDNYFSKNYPNSEFWAAQGIENSEGRTVVIPILIDPNFPVHKYPYISNKSYIQWTNNADDTADKLAILILNQNGS